MGDLYDEELARPLPKCPQGHDTELVPIVGDGEMTALLGELNLAPTTRECVEEEMRNRDPHTFRQRIGKRHTS